MTRRAKREALDAAALLAAWEWAAEIRRTLVALARDREGEWVRFEIASADGVPPPTRPGDWDALQLATFDREVAALARPADVFDVLEAFSGTAAIERNAAAVEELRRACADDRRWLPMDNRRRRGKRPLPPNARATVGEASRLAIDLVRLHFGRPLVDVGLLEGGDEDREDLLATVWEVAPERFAEAVRWCAPSALPEPQRLDLAAPAEWQRIIAHALGSEDVRATFNASRTDGERGGPEEAAHVLIETLTGASRNVVRACFRERYPGWRAELAAHRQFARDYQAAPSVAREPTAGGRKAMAARRRELIEGGVPRRGWLRERLGLARTSDRDEG